jgi:cytoskeletal protein RodZ
MSITLGEKLRQAREERGISISEVAEQTRISALYIQSIENDDYRTLPGGIFNKGFVKSFAKYVGVDEQEALQDYGALTGSQNIQSIDESKTYRPR